MKNISFMLFTLLLAATTYAQTPTYLPTSGLVAWYPFNGNANDSSGNGNNGTMNNGATYTADRFGNTNSAALLDGINDYIGLPSGSVTSLNITGDLTVSFWIKTTDNSGLLVSTGDNVTSPPTAGGYLSGIDGGNVGNGQIGVATRGNWSGSVGIVNDNNWHHITYILKSDTLRIYIDNVLDNQLTSIQTPLTWSGSRVIGCRHDLFMTTASNYAGAFDDIGIWNRALTPCEIQELYQAQLLADGSSITTTACNSYTLNGQTYTATGIYSQLFTNQWGCDSTVTLDLTINEAETAVTQTGITLTAVAVSAAYQWITCENNQPITEATSQNFTPTTNGMYAVVVTENNCTDTSACFTISTVGLSAVEKSSVTIYPNPFKNTIRLDVNSLHQAELEGIIYDIMGKVVFQTRLTGSSSTFNLPHLPSGIYFLKIYSTDNEVFLIEKLMKE